LAENKQQGKNFNLLLQGSEVMALLGSTQILRYAQDDNSNVPLNNAAPGEEPTRRWPGG